MLASHFERAGFHVCANEHHEEHTWQRFMLMQNLLLVGEGFVDSLRKRAVQVAKVTSDGDSAHLKARADELDQSVVGSYEEIRKGAYVRHDIQLVVGRKPT